MPDNPLAVPSAAGGPSDRLVTMPFTEAVAPAGNLFVPLVERDAAEVLTRPSVSFWKDAWLRLCKNKVAMASGVYIVLLVLAATVLPEFIHYSYEQQEIWNADQSPNMGIEALVTDRGVDFKPVEAPPAPPSAATDPNPPGIPTGLHVVGQPLSTGVVLQWNRVANAEGYHVYRATMRGTLGLPLDDVPATQLSYMDDWSLQGGRTYYYTVLAYNSLGGDSQAAPTIKVQPQMALSVATAQKMRPGAKEGQMIHTPAHYLGTDYLGRDMLARVLSGARISLFIGIVAPLLYILIGIFYGSISGYFGGFVDDVMMRIADIFYTVPDLLTVIMLQVVLGSGITTLVLALVITAWASSARQIRGEVLKVREMEYVQASRVLGTPMLKVMTRHLFPNVMGTVLVLLTLSIPNAIFAEAFLSFIGLGIAPPLASWGTVTREGAKAFLTYPHELLIPAALICVTMLAFNLLGDGLRDALDPRLRGGQ